MKTIFLVLLIGAAVWAENATLVAQNKRKPDVIVADGGGKEIITPADLYNAVPGQAKHSAIVGGPVKSYRGEVDMVCAQSTKICVITFLKK